MPLLYLSWKNSKPEHCCLRADQQRVLLVYAGQLINGSLDRVQPATVFGLMGTAVCNLLLGFSRTPWAMVPCGARNGIFQSTG